MGVRKPKDEKYERCVICGKLTDVPLSLPIDFSEEFELGCGQVCGACRIALREENDPENA